MRPQALKTRSTHNTFLVVGRQKDTQLQQNKSYRVVYLVDLLTLADGDNSTPEPVVEAGASLTPNEVVA